MKAIATNFKARKQRSRLLKKAITALRKEWLQNQQERRRASKL